MAGVHLTDVHTYITYSSVVSRDTVCIGFIVAAFDFLKAQTKEKIFFYAGDEWNSDKDKFVIVVRALYGLKYLALQFWNCLAETLGNRIGYK